MVISFQEVTDSAGISLIRQSWGVAWGDLNGDKLPDIWVNNHQQKPVTLYLNQGDGTFENVTNQTFVSNDDTIGDFHGPAWFDFDNDGDLDLLQIAGGDQGFDDDNPNKQNKLFVNNNGQLEDRAVELDVNYPLGRARVPVPVDIDNDGLLDFVYTGPIRNDGQGAATVFRQTADGDFENIGASTGLNTNVPNGTFALISNLTGDVNPELIYYDNNNPLTVYDISNLPFDDITNEVIPNAPAGLGAIQDIAAADFNNDLKIDLYVTQKGAPSTGFRRDSNQQARATLRPSANQERGLEFDAANGDVMFDFNGDIASVPNFFRGTNISPDDIFIGSAGVNPNSLEFTLDPNDPDVQGIADFTPTVDRGVYIGYDPTQQTWQVLWSSDRVNDELNLIFESTTQLSTIAPINFSDSFIPNPDFLLINSDNGFIDQTEESGLDLPPVSGHNVVAGDFDNDMDRDIYVLATGNVENFPNVMYENQGDGTFVAVPDAGGAEGTPLGVGDAVVVADYDLDGFLDLYTTNGDVFGFKRPFYLDGPNQLFRNQGNSNNWLQIDLEGVVSNRDGIGTQVFATAGGMTQLVEQNGGVHNRGQDSQLVHFGLADNTQVSTLEVQWTSGVVQKLSNIDVNQVIDVVEGVGLGGNDSITGSSGQDELFGNNGNDTLRGQAGNDILNGGDGRDDLFGNNGNDTLRGQAGNDILNGGGGRDELFGNNGDDLLRGQGSNDTLNGGGGRDRAFGNFGNDLVRGQGGNDTLDGGTGNDILIGNRGNDTITGQAGRDRFRFLRPTDGVDNITDFNSSDDTIEIRASSFGGGLNRGVLPNNRFVLGNSARDSNDRFIYNQNTGNLMYDADGVGGDTSVVLAIFSNQAEIAANDIVII